MDSNVEQDVLTIGIVLSEYPNLDIGKGWLLRNLRIYWLYCVAIVGLPCVLDLFPYYVNFRVPSVA